MRFVFRVDASTQIGTGHVMRCLTLAKAIHQRAGEVSFICQTLPGNLCQQIEKDFPVFPLPPTLEITEDAKETQAILKLHSIDWLVVDHYGLDARWESLVRPFVKQVMVIDDLANRPHDCDVLLDQNLCINEETRYKNLVPNSCKTSIGVKYLMLRPEFLSTRQSRTQVTEVAKNILVTIGGSDADNLTSRVLQSLVQFALPLNIRVAVGASCPYFKEIKAIASHSHQLTIQQNVSHMAEWMAWADLAISAGGFTCYELAYMGVPTLVLTTSPTQKEVAQALHRLGITCYLGESQHLSTSTFTATLDTLITSPKKRQEMANRGQTIFDGYGTQRVVKLFADLD